MTIVSSPGWARRTPLGGDVASDLGRHARRPAPGCVALTQDWAAELPVRIAAQLAVEPTEVIDRVKLRRLDRSEAVALIAAHRGVGRRPAWRRRRPDLERLAVSVGTGIGGAADPARPGRHPRGSRAAARVAAHRADAHAQRPGRVVGLESDALGRRPLCRECLRDRCRGDRARPRTSSVPAGPTLSSRAAPRRSSTRCRSPASPSMRAMSTRNDDPNAASRPWDKGRATDSCSARARRSWCSNGLSTPPRAGPGSTRALAGAGITSDGYDIVQPAPGRAPASSGRCARRWPTPS